MRALTGTALAIAMAAGPAGAEAPALTARLALLDPETGQETSAQDGRAVRLSVSLTDVLTGQPPRGLAPRVFARPMPPGAPSCEQAARAFRATGRVPGDAVDFQVPLLVSAMADGAITVADPRLNLQSANLIAAHHPQSPAVSPVLDPARARILYAEPAGGRVMAVPVAGGAAQVLAEGLDRPGAMLAGPEGLYVAVEGGFVVIPDSGPLRRVEMPGGPVTLRAGGGEVLAVSAGGRLRLGGHELALPPLADATPAGPGAVLALPAGAEAARLLYLDTPGPGQDIPLGHRFARIAADPAGRVALAWTPGEPGFVLIDLALARVAQAGELAAGGVAEVLLTREMAYLLSLDGGYVGTIALDSVRIGEGLRMQRVLLGPQQGDTGRGGPTRLLVPLARTGQVMAVLPDVQTAFLIDPVMALNGQPPMDGTRLRGGLPVDVQAYDRNFAEVESGRFEATWRFSPGPWELVMTTGLGGFTDCLPFAVAGERVAGQRLVRMAGGPGEVTAGERVALRLQFLDEDGQVVPAAATVVLVPALSSSWRGRAEAHPAADGSLEMELTLPHAGAFAVQPLRLPAGTRLRSGLVLMARAAP